MAWNVYPTETPVGTWNGDYADRAREYQHAAWLNWVKKSTLSCFRCSGGAFTHADSSSVDIPTGIYIINGYLVQNDGTDRLSGLTDDATNWIWVRLTVTGDIVTSAGYYSNTTGNAPAEPCVSIGQAIKSGGGTTCVYALACPSAGSGTLTVSGFQYLGFQPNLVWLYRYYAVPDDHDHIGPTSIDTYGFTASTFGGAVITYYWWV